LKTITAPTKSILLPTASTTSEVDKTTNETLIGDYPQSVDKGTGIHWISEAERLLARFSNTASELLPWLYLSGELPSCNEEIIQRLDIRVIINCAGEVVPNAFENNLNQGGRQVSYLTLCLRDGPFEDVFSLFYRVIRAIESARRDGGAALIHCHQGVSRSATFAIAYLMWAGGLSFSSAYNYTRSVREVVSPNAGFLCQLVEWEAFLRSLSTIYQTSDKFNHRSDKSSSSFPVFFRLTKLFDGCYESGPLLCTNRDIALLENSTKRQPIKMCLQLVRSTNHRAIIPATPDLIRLYDRDIVLVVAGACVDTKRNWLNNDESVISIEAYSVVGSKFVDSHLQSDVGNLPSERDKNVELRGYDDTSKLQNALSSLVCEISLWGALAVQPKGLQDDVLKYLSASSVRKQGVLQGINSTFGEMAEEGSQTQRLIKLLGSSFIQPPSSAIQVLLAQDVVFTSSEGESSATELNLFRLLEEKCQDINEEGRLAVDYEISEIRRRNQHRPSSADGYVRSPAVESSPRSDGMSYIPKASEDLIITESDRHESVSVMSVEKQKPATKAIVPTLKLHADKKAVS
jgi:hypothetical protein